MPNRLKQAVLMIYRSANGRDGWAPVPPAEVPEWLKDLEVMGKLVDGQECMDAAEGETGSYWYRAVRARDALAVASPMADAERIEAAHAKRARRAARRVLH